MPLPSVPLDVVGVIIEELSTLDPPWILQQLKPAISFAMPYSSSYIFTTVVTKDCKGLRGLLRLLSSTRIITNYIRKLKLPYDIISWPALDFKPLAQITGLRLLGIYSELTFPETIVLAFHGGIPASTGSTRLFSSPIPQDLRHQLMILSWTSCSNSDK